MHLQPSYLTGFILLICGTVIPVGSCVAEELAADDNRISWLLPDFPPVNIAQGPRRGTGYADVFLDYLTQHSPQFQHQREFSGMSRVFGLMQQGQHVCHPSLMKTPEREQFVDFSGPVEFVLSHHVVIRSDRVERLAAYRDAEGRVDIGRLMQDGGLTTTYQEQRGYPPVVQAALKANSGQKHVVKTGVDGEGPFRQLAAGWIDYMIAYPDEVNWFAEKLDLNNGGSPVFEYLPMVGMPEYVVGHVGCTKGEWGKRITHMVDEVVAQAGSRPVWIDAEARLLDPVAARRFEDVVLKYSPFLAPGKQ